MTETVADVQNTPAPARAEPIFYKIDYRGGTFREFLYGGSILTATLAMLRKWFGPRMGGSTDDPNVHELRDFEVAKDAMPPEVLGRFEPLARELESIGFRSPIYHLINDTFHSTQQYLATFPHESGQAMARIHYRIWTASHPPRVFLFTEFISAYDDLTFLYSSNGMPDSLPPPCCRLIRRRDAGATSLWTAHQQQLNADQAAGKRPIRISNEWELRDAVEMHHAAVRDFQLSRGLFSPLTEEDVRERSAMVQRRAALAAAGMQHAEVLEQIDKLQQKQSNWRNTLLLLAVSLGLFAVIGIGGDNGPRRFSKEHWNFLLLLIPVLFFHELGHYVTMKAFRYRNLRMFFIPMFGAAVTGRNYNVPGWKKAIVYLMGPVPGILLGVGLGIAAMINGNRTLSNISLLLLILNGLNLLPFIPLDGGWIMHALLFSRHYVLSVVFRALAVLVLLGVAFTGVGGVFLFPLAIVLAIGLPMSFRQARIAQELREAGLGATSPDDQNIPPHVAQIIVDKVKASGPRMRGPKLLAQQTLEVFEALNARPPGWLATLGLGGVYAGSFLLALIFAVVIPIQREGGIDAARAAVMRRQYEKQAWAPPTRKLTAHSVEQSSAGEASLGSKNTVVATFNDLATARAEFDRIGAQTSATLFGQSIFLPFATSDESPALNWLTNLRARGADAFVDGALQRGRLTLACKAPSESAAADLQQQMDDYFGLGMRAKLIPPWSPDAHPSPKEIAAQARARKTFEKLQMAGRDSYNDPRIKDLIRNMRGINLPADEQKLKELRSQMDKIERELRRDAISQIAKSSSDEIDTHLAEQYLELYDKLSAREFFKSAPWKLGQAMGQIALSDDGTPVPGADRYSANSGWSRHKGTLVRFDGLWFADVSHGGPALVQWLQSKGYTDFRYDVRGMKVFHPSTRFSDDSDDDEIDVDDLQ